jgi:predicted nucleic acid-binding protein
LRAWPRRLSSTLALTEVPRALRRAGYGPLEKRRARQILSRVALVDIDRRILAEAAALKPPSLRTVDAIHLATALRVREELVALITYDGRLAGAAGKARIEVRAPA